MPYHISIEAPENYLVLKLIEKVSMEEFLEINDQINGYLDESWEGNTLIIDINEATSTPQTFQQLRHSQTYSQRPNLRWILVVGENKLMRLMMLLTFNLSRPSLQFFPNRTQVDRFLRSTHSAS